MRVPFDRLLFDYLRLNAWLSGFVLYLLGHGVTLSGVEFQSAKAVTAARKSCNAVDPAWMFAAAVLAFPAPWRSKLLGMVAGFSALLPFNLVRIVTLFLAKSYAPEWFPTIHLEIWPASRRSARVASSGKRGEIVGQGSLPRVSQKLRWACSPIS